MECAEEDQVGLAVYQLKRAAHEWWRVQRQTHFQGQRLDHITWQHFSEVFHGEYFPDYAQPERRDQFHALVQGDLTVSQYHQRFVQLLRHVPHVAGNDQACAERFIAGLRPDLSSGSAGIRSQFRKLSTRGGGRSLQQKRQSRFAEQSVVQGAEQGSQEPVCYTCGLPGHFRRDCPMGQAPQQQQPVQYAQQSPQYQYPPQQQAPRQQQQGQYQQQAQQFLQPQQYQPYHQQQQYPQQPPQQQQPQQAPQRGRGRGRVMALTREQAEASNHVIERSCRVAGSCSVDATCQAAAFAFSIFEGVVPFVQGSCLWRAMRGGDGHSYEKAPTGAFFVWRDYSGTLLGWKRGSLGGRDYVATARPVATRLLPLPGTPILGSLLREYSGLRVRSSETSQQRQGARRAEETGR
ncbi:hypothetical protein Taro_020673 [Colocasia esculenta]|uniref:CCHC-type domain-containing protein n=1 Tax=Colocasia esculenta TaxID=4460 RepID=A0A843V958_COLES|nr:hypothetical protein [Colocasia esculenta]